MAPQGRDHHGQSHSEKEVLPTFRVFMDSLPSGTTDRGPEVEAPLNFPDRGPEVEAALKSIGPMTGEDINAGVLTGPRAITCQRKVGCSRISSGHGGPEVDLDRIIDDHFTDECIFFHGSCGRH